MSSDPSPDTIHAMLEQVRAAAAPLGIDLEAVKAEALGAPPSPAGARLFARHFGVEAAQALLAALREIYGQSAEPGEAGDAQEGREALALFRSQQRALMARIEAELSKFGVAREAALSFFASLDFDMGAHVKPLDEKLPDVPENLREQVAAQNRALREAMEKQLRAMGQDPAPLMDAIFADMAEPPQAPCGAEGQPDITLTRRAAQAREQAQRQVQEQLKRAGADGARSADILSM